MKHILTLLCVSLFGFCQAQLTNLQVYDYEVGDVLQTRFIGFSNYVPVYTKDSITGKTVSAGGDSITYSIHRVKITPATLSTPVSVQISSNSLVVTELNSAAPHLAYVSCLSPYLTSTYNACGVFSEVLHSNADMNCFEAPSWTSTLLTGLGGPYYQVFEPGQNTSSNYELIYFKTAQHGECGQNYSLASLKEAVNPAWTLSSNVVTDQLAIQGEEMTLTVRLLDAQGMLVKQIRRLETNTSVNVSDLTPGIYYIQLDQDFAPILRFIKL